MRILHIPRFLPREDAFPGAALVKGRTSEAADDAKLMESRLISLGVQFPR